MTSNQHKEAMQIPAYLAGSLSLREKLHLKQHLRNCLDCRQTFAELQSITDHMPTAASGYLEPPDNLRERILNRAIKLPQRQTLRDEAAGKIKDGAGAAIENPQVRTGFIAAIIVGILYLFSRKKCKE